MSKEDHYKHTQVMVEDSINTWKMIVWIPEEFAHVDNVIKIRDENDRELWNNYIVREVFNSLPSKYVMERSQDYKRTRDASDV